MDRKLKREFVSVQNVARGIGIVETIKNTPGCNVTEHLDTITIVCSTLRGIAAMIRLSTEIGPEGPTRDMLSAINEELVEFIS